MEGRKLGDNGSCFLVKDARLKKGWHLSPIGCFLKEEGFCAQKGSYDIEGIDWLYINIYTKAYAKGRGGIALAPVVGDHAITWEEFLTIYAIYKKYEGLSVLVMTR